MQETWKSRWEVFPTRPSICLTVCLSSLRGPSGT